MSTRNFRLRKSEEARILHIRHSGTALRNRQRRHLAARQDLTTCASRCSTGVRLPLWAPNPAPLAGKRPRPPPNHTVERQRTGAQCSSTGKTTVPAESTMHQLSQLLPPEVQ